MKKILAILFICSTLTSAAQYMLKTANNETLQNANKADVWVYKTNGNFDVYYTLEDDYFAAAFVYTNSYAVAERVEKYCILYSDVLKLLGDNPSPTAQPLSSYDNYTSKPVVFQLGESDETGKRIYCYKNTATAAHKVKVNQLVLYFTNETKADGFLTKLVAKAKEVAGAPNFKDNRFAFRDFDNDGDKTSKKEDDFLGDLDLDLTTPAKATKPEAKKTEEADILGDLDLDLTSPSSTTTAASVPVTTPQPHKTSYPPILLKRSGNVEYSIYFDESTASSLNTKIYQGDKAKLLFTTYNDIYKGKMPTRAKFEVCSWCGIYSIIDNDTRRIVFKDKPNAIKSEMIYKNDTWFLVKGSGTNTEINYESNMENAALCYTYPNNKTIYGKNGSLDIESEVQLTTKVQLWIMAMLFMAGYEK